MDIEELDSGTDEQVQAPAVIDHTALASASTDWNKNKSKELQFKWTASKLEKRKQLREHYKHNFLAWAEASAQVIDRDDPQGAKLMRFKAAPSQLSLLALREEIKRFNVAYSTRLNQVDNSYPISELPIEIVCLKARKVFVSTLIQLLAFHKCEFWEQTACLTVAHQLVPAQNIAGILRRVHWNWSNRVAVPLRLHIDRIQDNLVEWDKGWGSKMTVMTAGSDVGVSRGFTYHLLHLSEASSYPNASKEVANAEQACATYREIYTESTANGEHNFFHDEFVNAMWIEDAWKCLEENKPFPEKWNKKFRWFWAWWQDPHYRSPCLPHEEEEIKKTLSDTEKDLIANYNCDYAQLKWRRLKIKGECSKQRDLSPEDYFKQEYPSFWEEAFVSKGGSVFDKGYLKTMQKRAENDPALRFGNIHHEDIMEPFGGRLRIWTFKPSNYAEGSQMFYFEDPIPGDQYVIGGDVSEGLPWGDYSVASVFNRTNGTFLREAARWIGKMNPELFGHLLVYLAKFFNNAFVNCERNKDGSATNIAMVNLGYPNLYHGRDVERIGDVPDAETFTAGFNTGARGSKSKRVLVLRGQTVISDKTIMLRHPEAIKQWQGYRRLEDGSYGAEDGHNDDCVMADLMAIWGDEEGPPVMGARVAQPVDGAKVIIAKDLTPVEERKAWLNEKLQKIIERDRARNEASEEIRLAHGDMDIYSELFD